MSEPFWTTQFPPDDDELCSLCCGDGDIPVRRSPVIVGPQTEYTDGDRMVCPRCDGSGQAQ